MALLDVLYNKVDLERKFGVNLLWFSQRKKSKESTGKGATSAKTSHKPLLDANKRTKKTKPGKSKKIGKLSELQEQASKCILCGLHKGRTNVVFGTGNPDANLMFVGEAPGYHEDVQGEPFVGRAGQLLTKIIESIGLKRSDVYIANILKCRPPENRNPAANEIVLCTPYLLQQIEIINPKIICSLGTFATQTLLGTKESIGRLRGKFHEYQGTKLVATYHPAYLLRNPNDKRKTWEDIKKVRDFLKEELSCLIDRRPNSDFVILTELI